MNGSCFTTQIATQHLQQLKELLQGQHFQLFTAPHAHFAARKRGVSCIAYRSGTLTIQGKEKEPLIDLVVHLFQPAEALPTPRIGIDEAGKGDFFGPLCIAALYADQQGIELLRRLQVRDSKKLSDRTILHCAQQLQARFPHHVLTLLPPTYNALYRRFANLNHLLAWGHATTARQLAQKTACQAIVVDRFSQQQLVKQRLSASRLEVIERHHGESDVVVAAASIIARASYLEHLAALASQQRISLPKGASALVIATGKQLVARGGQEMLQQVAKVHFKTHAQIVAA